MVYCCVRRCPSRNVKKKEGITYHKFPADPQRRKLWVEAVKRENWQPTKHSSLCSVHFEERCFDRTSLSRTRLNNDAEPTLFPEYPPRRKKVANKPLVKKQLKSAANSKEHNGEEASNVEDTYLSFLSTYIKEQLPHVEKQERSTDKPEKHDVEEASNVEDISYSVRSTSTKEEPSHAKKQQKTVAKSMKHNGEEVSKIEDISYSGQSTSTKEEPSHARKQQKSVAKSMKNNGEEASNVEDFPTTRVKLPPSANNVLGCLPRVDGEDDNNLYSLKKNYCRLCAKKESALASAFGEEGELLDLVEKISRCLPIVLMSGDELPTSICYPCLQKLNTSYYFIEATLRAETVLKQKLEAIKSNMAATQMGSNAEEPEPELEHNYSSTQIHHSVTEDVDMHQNELISISKLPAEKVIDKDTSLKCDKCDIVFVSLDDFDLHMTRHFRKFQCRYCSVAFSGFNNLVAHKTEAHLEELVSCKECQHIRAEEKILSAQDSSSEFECKLCGQQFKNIIRLRDHYIIHHFPRTIVCNVCGKKCVSYFKYRFHKKTHYDMSIVRCRKCKRKFRSQASLNKHRLHPCQVAPVVCVVCGETFSSWVSQSIHLLGHSQFNCKHCDQKFTDSRRLKIHMRCHLVAKFKCNLCSRTFKFNENLSKHQAMHNKLKCSVCDKIFENLYKLKRHEFGHTHFCDICGRAGKTKKDLARHRALHFKHKFCQCKYCNATFNSHLDFTIHMKAEHQERKLRGNVKKERKVREVFKCRYCEKILSSKRKLIDHEHIHTGHLNCLCNICGKRFKGSINLYQHMTTHKEKRHICILCGKKFATKHGLKTHVWSHSDEKPYPCETCGKNFSLKANMMQHSRRHAGYKRKPRGAVFDSQKEVKQHIECHFDSQKEVRKYIECHATMKSEIEIKEEEITLDGY